MKRVCTFLLVGLLLAINSYTQAANSNNSVTHLDKIVAIVDREAITQSELNKEMEKARKQMEHYNQPIPPQAEFRKQILDDLIAKTLQLQLAKTKAVQVPDEDVAQAIQGIAKANKISVVQLKEAIAQTGMNYDEYQAQIKQQLLLQKLQQQELAKNITVTPEDVKKFSLANRTKFSQFSAFHVMDIVLPVSEQASAADKQQAKQQAEKLAKKLQTEKDVNLAMQAFTSAELNDLGWRSLADIPSLFQGKIAAMQVNAVSSPIPAPNGYHVLKLLEVKGQNIAPTENQLKNMAYQEKMTAEVKTWLIKLRQDSYVKILN
jgi:peptidyl-prolyl cis-trans isomerase SurA